MSETYLDDAGEKILDQLYRTLPDSLTNVYDALYDFMSAPNREPDELNYFGRFDASRYLEG